MSEILDNFDKANKYFADNYARVQKKYSTLLNELKQIYNSCAPNPGSNLNPQQGTALAIALRALKFLYTAADLVQRGHTQEARIIFRNVQELRLVMLDIATDQESYELWRLTQNKKEEIKKDGVIDSSKLKEKIIENCRENTVGKLTVKSSIKRLKKKNNEHINEVLNEIVQAVDILSEFVSHENIFNLVRRMDVVSIGNRQEQIDIYVGVDANSALNSYLEEVLNLFKKLKNDIEFILQYKV